MTDFNKNSDGKNKTYFHGTDKSFERFNKDIVWVSETPLLANEYAELREDMSGRGAIVKPVWISAKRSFDADKLDNTLKIGPFLMELARQSQDITGIRPDDEMMREAVQTLKSGAYREESGPWYEPKDFWFNSYEKFGVAESKMLNELFVKLGFDSISYSEESTMGEKQKTIGVLSSGLVASSISQNIMHGSDRVFQKEIDAEIGFKEKITKTLALQEISM